MRIKIITGTNSKQFEDDVNEWLKEFSGLPYEIDKIKYSTVAKEDGTIFFSVMIVYFL
jgi:hypothetical protein